MGRDVNLFSELIYCILIYFIFYLLLLPTWLPPKWSNHTPPALPAGHSSCPFFPLLRPGVYGWLLCTASLFGDRLKPHHILLCLFILLINFWPKWQHCVPPHVLPRSRLLSNAPPTVDADFYLIVVCNLISPGHLRPRPHLSLFFCL